MLSLLPNSERLQLRTNFLKVCLLSPSAENAPTPLTSLRIYNQHLKLRGMKELPAFGWPESVTVRWRCDLAHQRPLSTFDSCLQGYLHSVPAPDLTPPSGLTRDHPLPVWWAESCCEYGCSRPRSGGVGLRGGGTGLDAAQRAVSQQSGRAARVVGPGGAAGARGAGVCALWPPARLPAAGVRTAAGSGRRLPPQPLSLLLSRAAVLRRPAR